MRLHQLQIRLESFGEKSTNKKRNIVRGYVDGNNIYEVLQEELKELHKIYEPNISFDEFFDNIKNFNGNRFGRTEIKDGLPFERKRSEN